MTEWQIDRSRRSWLAPEGLQPNLLQYANMSGGILILEGCRIEGSWATQLRYGYHPQGGPVSEGIAFSAEELGGTRHPLGVPRWEGPWATRLPLVHDRMPGVGEALWANCPSGYCVVARCERTRFCGVLKPMGWRRELPGTGMTMGELLDSCCRETDQFLGVGLEASLKTLLQKRRLGRLLDEVRTRVRGE